MKQKKRFRAPLAQLSDSALIELRRKHNPMRHTALYNEIDRILSLRHPEWLYAPYVTVDELVKTLPERIQQVGLTPDVTYRLRVDVDAVWDLWLQFVDVRLAGVHPFHFSDASAMHAAFVSYLFTQPDLGFYHQAYNREAIHWVHGVSLAAILRGLGIWATLLYTRYGVDTFTDKDCRDKYVEAMQQENYDIGIADHVFDAWFERAEVQIRAYAAEKARQ